MEGFNEQFEIAEEGTFTRGGFFKIFPSARQDALTLTGDSVIIGGEVDSPQQLSIEGTGLSSGIELTIPNSDTTASLTINDLTNSFLIAGRGFASNSSNNVFRTSLDAPTNTFVIDDDGDIGLGTLAPDSDIHILGRDAFTTPRIARLLVEEVNASVASRSLLRLMNNGSSRLEMTNTDSGRTWSLVADVNNQFQIRQNGPNTANFAIRGDGTFSFNNAGQSQMALRPDGNLRISGVLFEGSDRNSKKDIEKVDSSEVLAKVIDLPVSTWKYKADESDSSHVGPMAQDFHAAFGLGDDDKRIATLDTSGVALAAIQGLNEKLESKNVDLQKRIDRLEKMVEALSTE